MSPLNSNGLPPYYFQSQHDNLPCFPVTTQKFGSGTDKGEHILDDLLAERDSFGKDDSSSSLQLGNNNINVPPSVTLVVLSDPNSTSIFDPSLLRLVINEAV